MHIQMPPSCFGLVEREVYRSNKFSSTSFPFLKQLGLRTVLNLSSEPLTTVPKEFCQSHSIQIVRIFAIKKL